jgi:hypothetical protein
MYNTLLILHSWFRWLVVLSLFSSFFIALKGYVLRASFTKFEDSIRYWTATFAHIQLCLGIILYLKSPLIAVFTKSFELGMSNINLSFFGLFHSLGMFLMVILLTVGSALAKRKQESIDKYKTMLIYFGISLLILILLIPWSFSPLVQRPYFRF